MTKIEDVTDPTLLSKMISDRMITVKQHPTYPLSIYNYTPAAVYSRNWNSATSSSRGLIVNSDTGEVVARPFKKFHNFSEPEVGRLPAGPAIVASKMDGSLGVLYGTSDGYKIATRGSFTSPQAIRGTQIFDQVAPLAWFVPLEGKTYLYEVIYPENRIVVDYGQGERLVLLDVIDNETGASDLVEFDSCDWPDKVDRRVVHLGDHDGDAMHSLLDDVPEDEEGLVFYFPYSDTRVKLKKSEYVRLHRIITGVSTKTIWETLSKRGNFDELLDRVPDEFYMWMKTQVANFKMQYAQAHSELSADYMKVLTELPVDFTRKDFALHVNKNYKGKQAFMFALLDRRDLHDLIWSTLKPAYEKPFAQATEDNN